MKKDEPKTFEEILKRKIDYYGESRAAYEFAAEEYARSVIQSERLAIAGDAFEAGEAYVDHDWHMQEFHGFNCCDGKYPPNKEEYLRTLNS